MSTRLDALLARLREARDVSIRQKKARYVEEFLTARRLLHSAYKGFSPDEMPIDISRVVRDLEIERNAKIDEAVEEIKQSFEIAMRVLAEVAERSPALYDEVCLDLGVKRSGGWSNRKWEKGSALLRTVDPYMKRKDSRKVVSMIVASGETGCRFHDLVVALKCGKDRTSRGALRKLLFLLRAGQYLAINGTGKGARYVALPGLLEE